jgi:hypothetical protein
MKRWDTRQAVLTAAALIAASRQADIDIPANIPLYLAE